MADWSLASLQLKLIKIGARVVRHARAITFQLSEVAVSGPMVRAILTRSRGTPLVAQARAAIPLAHLGLLLRQRIRQRRQNPLWRHTP